MALVAPHPHLSSFTSIDSVARAVGGNFGTLLTSGAANTAGTWTQIHAGLTYPSDFVQVTIGGVRTSGDVITATTLNAYVDIGIGPDNANVTTLVEKLCGTNAQGIGRIYFFPLRLPPDQVIWARHQNTAASAKAYVNLMTLGGNMNPGTLPRVERVVCLGAAAASTTGTAITPGNAAEGAWTQIVASTTEDYAGVMIGGLFNVDTTMTSGLVTVMDASIGGAGNELTIGENLTMQHIHTANEQVNSFSTFTLCGIPTGARLCVRASGSTTPDSSSSVVLYAFTH